MFRMESGVVLKYFPAMDSFVKIRVFTEEEISRLMTRANITDKRSYFGLILNACLLHYNDLILPKVPHDDPSVEETLYKLCIEVNPSLDINKVSRLHFQGGGSLLRWRSPDIWRLGRYLLLSYPKRFLS